MSDDNRLPAKFDLTPEENRRVFNQALMLVALDLRAQKKRNEAAVQKKISRRRAARDKRLNI